MGISILIILFFFKFTPTFSGTQLGCKTRFWCRDSMHAVVWLDTVLFGASDLYLLSPHIFKHWDSRKNLVLHVGG